MCKNYALQLVDFGIPIFPCEPHTKHPYTKHGFKDASLIPKQIETWWVEYPEAVIGFPTGDVSGLSILDLDIDKKTGLLPSTEIPHTLVLPTKSGGQHFYYKHLKGVRSNVRQVGPQIDVRAEGGYVIVWEPKLLLDYLISGNAFLEFPVFLLPEKKEQFQPKDFTGEVWLEGERDDSLFRWGCSLRGKGLQDTEIAAAVREANKVRCIPPLPDSEVETKIKQICKFIPGETREKRFETSENDVEVYKPTKLDELIAFIQNHRRQTPSFEEIRVKFKLSPPHLSNILAKDKALGKKSMFRTLRRGQSKYLTFRKGSGLVRSERLILDTLDEVEPKAWLPANFHDYVATDLQGLKRNTFLLFVGETDFGKTQFLINCAVENINRGLNVVYVQHEADATAFWWNMARRYLGKRPKDNFEANQILESKKVYDRVNLQICRERAHIDEFLEEMVELKPDVLIYDYLDQEYLETDEQRGGSIFHNIVHSFGNKVVDEGIPFISAVQQKRRTGSKDVEVNSNWLLRANIAMVAQKKPVWTPEGYITPIFMKKNKQGDNKGKFKLEMVSHGQSFRILEIREGRQDG